MSHLLDPSTLHQWFKIPLGHASNRHYSREPVNCDRSGIFGWMAIIPLVLGLLGIIGLFNAAHPRRAPDVNPGLGRVTLRPRCGLAQHSPSGRDPCRERRDAGCCFVVRSSFLLCLVSLKRSCFV